MAETKPKGDPVFLTIAGEKVTLPGVTSFNTDDELSAAANDWIAENYKGPQVSAPTVFRTPKMDEKGGFKPGEEIVVQAPVARPFEQSLLGAAGEGAQQIIGEQLGIDPSTMAALAPDQGFISQFNRNLLQSAQPFTQMLELGSAAPTAALSGLAQLAYNLGLTSEDPRRTAAAAEEAINVGLLPLGTMTGPRVPTARDLTRGVELPAPMQTIAAPTPELPPIPRSIAKPKPVEVPETKLARPAFENEIPAPLPEVNLARANVLKNGENYRTDLTKWTPKLYRETSPKDLEVFLPTGGMETDLKDTDLFFADTPDLALGQGANKGVLMEFDATGLSGKLNKGKPSWRLGVENASGSEFIANLNPTGKYRRNLSAVRVSKNVTLDKVTQARLPRALNKLEQEGWVKTETDEFIQYSRPQAAEMPEAPALTAAVPEAAVAPAVPRARMPEEQGLAGIKSLEERGLTKPIADTEITDKVLRFETDYLKETGLSRPENLPLKDFFFMHFDAGTLPAERTIELAKQAGIDPKDLSDFVAGSQQTATEAGRILRARMVMSKYINKEGADIAQAGVNTPDELGLWKRTTDVTRGLMVSQLATSMRNTIGALARVPIDMATSLTSTGINAAMNPFRQDPVGTRAMDAFALLTDRLQPARNKQFYEQLRINFPKVNKELNSTFAADIAGPQAKDKFGKIEKVVNSLNLVNRVTETSTRNLMFPVYLRRELTRRGLDIDTLVDTNRLNEVPEDAINAALRETMDFTYGASPKTDHAMGKAADGFIKMVEALGPAGVTIAPFPRFMVSALRFQAEYNPLGVTRLLSKANRDAMRAGDPEVLSKAIVGSGLIGAAYLFRNSDSAGEKWSEAKLPDGRTVDMKAYFPIPQYLLVADIIKRYNDGKINGQTLDQAIDAKEIFQAVTGSQFRAGTGLYVVDQFIKDLSDAGSEPKKYLDIIGKFAADYGAALFTPMQTLKDFYAEYNPEEAIYRDTKGDFTGTLLRSVPGAQRALNIPEAESPTREGPMTTENPALRQLLGVTIRPKKNIVESELDRLGLTAYDVGSRTGDATMDRFINRDIGIIAERGIAPLLQSPQYQQLDNVQKSAAIKNIYAKAREAANAKFTAENPELAMLKKFKGMKREEQIMLNRQVQGSTGMSAPELLRQLSEAPLMKSQAQYDALPNGTKFTDPGDYKVYTKGE